VPVIPDTAPFTAEQRAWLNGFLAGLFSRAPLPGPGLVTAETPVTSLRPLTILFGSQTGNAESLSRRAAKIAGQRGFAATAIDVAEYNPSGLDQEQNLLLIISTYGDGEPPDSAKPFSRFLLGDDAPTLPQLRYSVCALGDSSYEKFCRCGRDLDERLATLQAHRVAPRVDCDVDFEEPFTRWLDQLLPLLADDQTTFTPSQRSSANVESTQRLESAGGRANPFPARLLTNRLLNGAGSARETRHFEIDLDGSNLNYEVGDALGVMPDNCATLVDDLIAVLGCDPQASVPVPGGDEAPLRDALLKHYEITRIPKALLAFVAERSDDATLRQLIAPNGNGTLEQFLWGRQVMDVLLAFPQVKVAACEFVRLLKSLQPRLYSISSSPKAHPGQVHLTVNVLRYVSLGRQRKGVCSTFLADRSADAAPLPVFLQPNSRFRPPPLGDVPMIMVGPGTGIAPFRAFLEERRATGAKGRNWLYFGDQHAAGDFLYRDELQEMLRDGSLTRLDVAFSRDQKEKVYVQHRMLENAVDLFEWLEAGAHFYVCGDAARMAKDVHVALHQVIERAANVTPEQAAEYVTQLQTTKRYQRDVY
jgi:sulfite reductase (NADPH) flavoprotein alpha-component